MTTRESINRDPPTSLGGWSGELEAVAECPSCGAREREVAFANLQDISYGVAGGTWMLQSCLVCRVLYLDPRPTEATVHQAYACYYTHSPAAATSVLSGVQRLRLAVGNGYRNSIFGTELHPALRIGAHLIKFLPAQASRIRREYRGLGHSHDRVRRVLDVGCGNGEFLKSVCKLGWAPYGIEMDPAAQKLAAQHGEILAQRIEDVGPEYDGLFDAITLSHVIEHLYRPREVLQHCYRLLKPGGYLWIETPNCHSMGLQIYGRYWRGLECPRHLVLFHAAALRALLQGVGFVRVEVLPAADVTEQIFLASERARAGGFSERAALELPERSIAAVKRAARSARRAVRRDNRRSEFITITGFRREKNGDPGPVGGK